MADFSSILAFAREHAGEDPIKLLLRQSQYPQVDMKMVAQQLEGRRQASTKWPRLSLCADFVFPPKLNREQSSSEQTAIFKSSVILSKLPHDRAITIADLTGGMGIDCIAFATNKEVRTAVEYVEMDEELVGLMEHNTKALGISNIQCHQGESIQWLRQTRQHFDILYVDPARRDSQGKKVQAFEDCQPNILESLPLLLESCDRLVIKASPMIDLHTAINQLHNVEEVFINSVKGECKEVIFICSKKENEVTIHCANCLPLEVQQYTFSPAEEQECERHYCQDVGQFMYEPNASLMKGGCFGLIGKQYGLCLLGRNTHLYTSDKYIEKYPGRTFRVVQKIGLNKKSIQEAIPQKKAHVITKNYPVKAAELQKQIGLSEGGELFVIATTVGNTKCGLLCEIVG